MTASRRKAEARMAELGVEPILVEEPVAAAACGMKLERFRAECPIRRLQEGQARLLPLDEVRTWAKRYWAAKTASGAANDQTPNHDDDWQNDFD